MKRFVSSNTCPKCNAHMEDVKVWGDQLVARCGCGWSGVKVRPAEPGVINGVKVRNVNDYTPGGVLITSQRPE